MQSTVHKLMSFLILVYGKGDSGEPEWPNLFIFLFLKKNEKSFIYEVHSR